MTSPNDSELKLKKKYVRSVIKLGNSKAITFPQDWTNKADLQEKSEVNIYPLDDKTIVIRTFDKEKPKTIFRIIANLWPLKLIRQALIAAFKLGIDEILLSYDEDNFNDVNKLLIDLRSEIIGFDFKNVAENDEFLINFLLDESKTTFYEVLTDLSNVLSVIIKNILEGTSKNDYQLILDEIDRKYSLGTRILIMGLSDYPLFKHHNNLPSIRYLGDRVVLLYIRDFINEALNLRMISNDILKKYAQILPKIPNLIKDIIKNYDNINLNTISEFQEYLETLNETLENIQFDAINAEDQQVRNTIHYYLNGFKTFLDIGITRLIESEIGIA
jgi:antitoxin component of MazEF toxin-antitoxin module